MSDSPVPGTSSSEDAAPGMATGLFKSLANMLATLVAFAQTRLELLTTELQEEVQRTASLMIWGVVAMLCAMMGLLFAALTIIVIFWDEHRILAASLVTGFFLIVAVAAVIVLIVKVNSKPRFLDATLAELARDADTLKEKL